MGRDRTGLTVPCADDPEAIALRIHQLAAVVGVLAVGQAEPLSHALHLVEECLLDVEGRVERLRARSP